MRIFKFIHSLTPMVLLALGAVTQPAMASIVQYTISTTATGILGGSSFTNAGVSITLTGDTGTEIFLDSHSAIFGTAFVNVSGVGSAALLGTLLVVHNPSPAGFITIEHLDDPSDDTSGTGILGIIAPSLASWDITTAVGPITAFGGPASGSSIPTFFPTSVGNLHLDFGSGSQMTTFTAIVVPEPSSASLLTLGLAASTIGLALPLRRLKAQAQH